MITNDPIVYAHQLARQLNGDDSGYAAAAARVAARRLAADPADWTGDEILDAMHTVITGRRVAADVKAEADMSLTAETRGQAVQDLGAIETPVPAQLKALTGPIRPMRDSFIIKGMTVGERVDAATSDLPADITTWTPEEIAQVETAADDLRTYCLRARAAHDGPHTSSLSADPDSARYTR